MSSANWNDQLVGIFVECLHEEVSRGDTAENGFKKAQWTSIADAFRARSGLAFSKAQLQSKLASLKKKYTAFKSLKENSGFGWDEDLQIPTAPDAVWARYLEVHKDAREFRTTALPLFAELDEIFTGSVATGQFARASTSFDRPAFQPRIDQADSEATRDDSKEDTTQNAPAIWTPRSGQHLLPASSGSSDPPNKRARRDRLADAIFAMASPK